MKEQLRDCRQASSSGCGREGFRGAMNVFHGPWSLTAICGLWLCCLSEPIQTEHIITAPHPNRHTLYSVYVNRKVLCRFWNWTQNTVLENWENDILPKHPSPAFIEDRIILSQRDGTNKATGKSRIDKWDHNFNLGLWEMFHYCLEYFLSNSKAPVRIKGETI